MSLIRADARALPLVDRCVQVVVTSPPYFGLRQYPDGRQIGSEATPDAYVAALVAVFREVRRVLKDDGVLWLNLGTSYHGGGRRGGGSFSSQRPGWREMPSVDGSDPIQSLRAPRVPACGTDGTGLLNSTGPDSSCSDLCDGCRDAIGSHRERTERSDRLPEPAEMLSSRIVRGTEPRGYEPSLVGGPLLASEVSMLLGSSEPRQGDCRHCANCGVCLSVLRSVSRDGRLCVRNLDYSGDRVRRDATWRRRMTDTVLSSTAWRYLTTECLKAKDDCAIPSLVALALRMDGWYLRQEIIWSKPNAMPSSVDDRCTTAHESLFLLSKSATYYFDAAAIREPYSASTLTQFEQPYTGEGTKEYAAAGVQNPSDIKRRITDKQRGHRRRHAGFNDRWDAMPKDAQQMQGANKRSVWTVATMPFAGAHFATMPEKLVEPCILAGSRLGDRVLDPFVGSGTVLAVAARLGRRGVGTDLSYQDLARKRTAQRGLLFTKATA